MVSPRRLFCTALAVGCLAAAALVLTEPAGAQKLKLEAQPAIQIKQPPGGVMVQVGGPGMPGGPGLQPGVVGQPPRDGSAQFSAIDLNDSKSGQYREYINAARACIKGKEWSPAAEALQAILDAKEDTYVQVKDTDAQSGLPALRWASVKFEANNILGSMPKEGLDMYENMFGDKARTRLREALEKNDRESLADVAQRFLHTKAGAEANEKLATFFLDRGQYFMAALRFERFLALRPDRAAITDLTRFKAALAYRRAGDVKNSKTVWEQLEPTLRAKGGLAIGTELIPTEKLQAMLDTIPAPEPVSPFDWRMVWGSDHRPNLAQGSPPLLDLIQWRRPTVLDKDDFSGKTEEKGAEAKTWIDRAIDNQSRTPGTAILPGFFPIAVGNLLVYRTYNGATAVYLRDDPADKDVKAGGLAWKTTDFDGALASVLGDPYTRQTLESWLQTYVNQPALYSLVYGNTVNGTLSSDGKLVYMVDDLSVPVPPFILQQLMYNPNAIPAAIKPLVNQNSLQAYDLQSGKYVWRFGDPKKNDDFSNSHFLGTPLSVGGKLFVLNETGSGELRLVTIDPRGAGNVAGIQRLGTVQSSHKVAYDISRRTNTVFLAYGEGILVCPTNAGELFGIDLLTKTLAWSYPYQEKAPEVVNQPNVFGGGRGLVQQQMRFPTNLGNWKVTPPVIQDGKVIFTAPDASSVHCIRLRDGKQVWRAAQANDDLYLAGVFNGKALVVGKNGARALRLKDGEQVWRLDTGDLPSGQGVFNQSKDGKHTYFLPLQKGEICAIDLDRGAVRARIRAGVKAGGAIQPPPGNLVFYDGAVLSQTTRELVAYPQLVARLKEKNDAVAAAPNDPRALTDRGEILLADGQIVKAVDDLRNALRNNPAPDLLPRTRAKLYDALTDLFETNFNDASQKYLDEYRDLCKVPDDNREEQRRLGRFLRLNGEGREAQGKLVEAYRSFREYGSLPLNKEQGIANPDDPAHKIPSDIWVKGRIAAMIAKATADQRPPLDEEIAAEWKAVRRKNDADATRSFVSLFDVPFRVGREARLQLADHIISQGDKGSYLEAELYLQQLRLPQWKADPAMGGQALEALARLEQRRGTPEAMRLAVEYYRQLKDEFPKQVIREGKTGADLYAELTSSPPMLPYLKTKEIRWPKGEVAARELGAGQLGPPWQGFLFYPEEQSTPFLQRNRLVVDPANRQVRLVDTLNNKVHWSEHLPDLNTNWQYMQYLYQQNAQNMPYQPNARFRFFHSTGQLAVVQVANMAYGIDMGGQKVLWKYNLLEGNNGLQPGVVVNQVWPDNEGVLQIMGFNQMTQTQVQVRIGYVAAVQPSYVALVTQKGLVVLDPLRGAVLWTKSDVPTRMHVFGDESNLYLVDVRDGVTGAGRAVRATDAAPVNLPDFAKVFRHKVRMLGSNRILAAQPAADHLVLRFYDVPTGKDLYSQKFHAKAVVLQTDEPGLAGVLEPEDGKVTVIDLDARKVVVTANIKEFRIADPKNKALEDLKEPLLVRDAEQYYVALNKAVEGNKVWMGIVSNNFGTGLRCFPVNGFLASFDNKGEFLWHSDGPIHNQMLVLEQFRSLPALVLTARYMEMMQNNMGGFNPGIGQRWVLATQVINKASGKRLYDPANRGVNNGNAQFAGFTVDPQRGAVNLIGYGNTVQIYINDGKQPPPARNDGGGTQPPDLNSRRTPLNKLQPRVIERGRPLPPLLPPIEVNK
jgi:outer membrane protein assembly factor BamB/tetratricopeptide (TPR) repeat protein